MNRIHLFLILLISLIASALQAEILKLKSDPIDADVLIRDLGNVQTLKIGKTPFEGNIADLAANYVKSNFFIIVVEKPGYESQSILLSDLLKSDIELSLNLLPKEDSMLFRKLDKNINDIFESQRLIRSNQYDEAISLLKSVELEQPKLSIVPEIIGSAFYLKKDYKASLSWYEKAYRVNPENHDAFTYKGYLRKALGSK